MIFIECPKCLAIIFSRFFLEILTKLLWDCLYSFLVKRTLPGIPLGFSSTFALVIPSRIPMEISPRIRPRVSLGMSPEIPLKVP